MCGPRGWRECSYFCSEDIGKFVFTVTVKTSARVWILQAADEPTLNQWIAACTPMLGERTAAVRSGGDKKAPKPRPGLPLPYPPTYVQGWSELDNTVITAGVEDWTGLSAKQPVLAAALQPGAVALTVGADGAAVVDEVRELALDSHGEAYVDHLPAELQADSVTWSSKDTQLVQTRFEHDGKTQRDLLRKVVGRKVTASYTNVQGAGQACTFTGKVFYDHDSDRFALVDEASHSIHFFDFTAVGSAHSIPGAHTLQLLDANSTKLNASTTDAFVAPRLWSKFQTNSGASAAKTTGSLTYHLKSGSLPSDVRYALVLAADEQTADVSGWYVVSNKTSKTFNNAAVTYRAGANEEVADKTPEEEQADAAAAVAAAAGEGGLLAAARAKAAAVAAAAGALSGAVDAGPRSARLLFYPLVRSVTLQSHETTNVAFLSKNVPVKTMHLVRFDTPGYSIRPYTAKDEGKVSGGFGNKDKEPCAIIDTVVRFDNPLAQALPTGGARISRRDRSGLGAHPLGETRLMRVESGGEEVLLSLGKPHGIIVSRTQTGQFPH